jgi:hypothetical protein
MESSSKKCNGCLEIKDLEKFGKDKTKKDGRSTQCRECRRKAELAYNAKNREKRKLYAEKYREENRELVNQNQKDYYKRNKSKVLKSAQVYRENNLPSILNRNKLRKAHQRNLFKNLNKKQQSSVLEIYQLREDLSLASLAAGSSTIYHVDHIIPLNGDRVSGLHVPSNLQLLPAKENMMKSNSFY